MNDQEQKDTEVDEADESAQQAVATARPDGSAPAEAEPNGAEKGDEADSPEPPEPPEPVRDTSHLKWYVVHTYSGFENKAKQALEDRIKREELQEEFGEILIPTEEVVEMSRGKRRTSKRKFFPGYILVQMSMSEASWYLVKSTPKITGFVGNSTSPQPVSDKEMRRISSQIAEGSERLMPKVIFERGDSVRVVDGPFNNFNGTIDDVDQDKGKLRVLVSIFGRATPVEMEFIQVEKT